MAEGREGGTSDAIAHPNSPDPVPDSPAPEPALPSPACEAAGEGGRRPGGGHLATDGEPPSADLEADAPALDVPPTFTPIDTSRGRFKRNVLANLAYFVFNAGIQLWFVRYLIDNLGVATYGLVPLATNITGYMAIVTVALSGSVGRFLTIDLARGDVATANRTFNTSLFASIVLAVALVPVAGALSWFAPSFLNIPAGEEMGTRFLLMCTCFAFLLNAVGSNFACSTFAKNRFDVQRGIDALGFITQIGVVVALFTWAEGDLWYVGAGIAASAVVRQICYQVSWRRLTPELSIRLASFDRTRLREVLGMGGWLMTTRVGGMLLAQSDLLVANVVLGAHSGGLYAPVVQLVAVVRAMASTITATITPTLATAHGREDSARLRRLATDSVTVLGLVVALPAGLVAGLSPWLLDAWLGPRFAGVAPMLALASACLVINIAVGPFWALFHATNRLSGHGIATIASGVVSIALSFVLAGPAGLGLWGIAVAGALVMAAKNAIWTPWYAAIVLKQPNGTFMPCLSPGIVSVLVLWVLSGATARALGSVVPPLVAAAAAAFVATVIYLPLAWRWGLPANERARLLGRFRGHVPRQDSAG
ncbi:MAG: lipopolysaccharide biosynthesis protein [candidate division WS1 bacterium]|nr:lipopolysaccharide biosynthesis protein [candidate division WS1 bacterium]